MSTPEFSQQNESSRARFATTSWSVILQAKGADSVQTQAALENLCRVYWYPLYAFVRRKGFPSTEAEDLTQSFFHFLLDKKAIGKADKERGKFRTFLLGSLTHFLHNHWRRESADKRNPQAPILSLQLDFSEGEQKYLQEPAHQLSPERIFERNWALTLLDEMFSELQSKYQQMDKSNLFDQLSPFLSGSKPPSYQELAKKLAMTEGALKVAMHRMRSRSKAILRAKVAETVESDHQIDEEIRELFAIFAKS